MGCADRWTVQAGSPGREEITVRDKTGAVLAFDGSEPLRARIWDGDRLAPADVAPTAAHKAGSPGVVVASLSPTATAALATGVRRWMLEVQLGGEWWPAYDSVVEILDAPGADAPDPVYSSMQDLTDVAGWLVGTSAKQAATDYRAQRADARAWLDAIILARIRPSTEQSTDLRKFVGAWGPADGPDPWYSERLAAGALLVDRPIRRACSLYAAALVADSKVGLEAKAPDPWPDRAARFHAEARRAVLALRVALDLDGDGRADRWVHLGRFTIR